MSLKDEGIANRAAAHHDGCVGITHMLKRMGPYRLEKLLGRGGMGNVYVGIHEETGQRAAIKSLAHALADDENFRSRFLVEVETLKQLRHPNIVRIFGDGEQDGQLFYVMELVEGKSLQELLQSDQTFSWRDVTRIAIDVCGALKHAHDCGVIHRDIKPANLLKTGDGIVKLTDFGIAKLFGGTHRTAEGSVVGTADFMSPEQSDGRLVTNRTDLYSLGAVMFTLLARRAPFQGGTLAQVVHKLKYEEAPSVRRHAPQVPEALEQIIGELLRKDPQQRVATALTLANRLRAMEHVLNSREYNVLPPDESTQAGSLPPEGDSGTGMVIPDKVQPTEVSRTVANGDDSQSKDGFPWNEATIQKSTPPPLGVAPNGPSAAPPSVPETPTPGYRFTTIDDDERGRVGRLGGPEPDAPASWQTISGLAVLLAGIVGVCVWGLMPPSADALYRRIQATVTGRGAADARKDIDEFLQRFPDDVRFGEVDDLRMDVECEWLESRLRLRKRKTDGFGLETYEQAWLEAYLLHEAQPDAAREAWESILTRHGRQPAPPESLQTILAATRHQLKRYRAREGSE